MQKEGQPSVSCPYSLVDWYDYSNELDNAPGWICFSNVSLR
jgi:hypothetical protein